MLLTPYGFREWFAITVVCALAAVGLWFVRWPLVVVVAVVWLALLSFFRDPVRRIPGDLDPGDMLSPADGVISAIERVGSHAATEGPAVVVRIFLSVLNVHVNRSPFDAEVLASVHTPGKFLNARTDESARVNESNLMSLRVPSGESIGVKQIAGLIARRIVCPVTVGEKMTRGQKFGMIKFGSTTELILPRPDEVEVLVKIGQRVRGGLTVLARLPGAAGKL